jgi:hypothetical protein
MAWSVDRLGRSLQDLVGFLSEIHALKVDLYLHQQGLVTRAGWSVKIADLDTMQGTSTKWKIRRDAAKLEPEIPVEKFGTVERAMREAEKYDLLIIDGPAHAEKGG